MYVLTYLLVIFTLFTVFFRLNGKHKQPRATTKGRRRRENKFIHFEVKKEEKKTKTNKLPLNYVGNRIKIRYANSTKLTFKLVFFT